ncbi:MAG: hypothetical protein H0W83_00875 [Planctomycetes bacterium]|nr:hypothetical protein [Planctomycetota bacterium]
MTRIVLIAVIVALLSPSARAQVYDLTLPPLTVDVPYTPGSVPSFSRSITLPCGPTGFVIDAPPTSQIFYQFTGPAMSPPEALVDAQGRMTWLAYSDPLDQFVNIVYCDSPIDYNFSYSINNPNRHYGLLTLRIDPNNTAANPGLNDLFVTDLATGAKITGAVVTFNGVTITGAEVGLGQYRITANATTTATTTVTRSPYTALSFSSRVRAGLLGGIALTMTDPTPGTVTLTTTAAATTAANPVPVALHFVKPVDAALGDFTIADLTVSGGTVQSLDGGGQDYLAQIIPTAAAVQVSVAAGVARDRASVANAASNVLNRTYDGAGPTVTISQAAGQSDPASTYPVRFAIVFSAPVNGFTASDVVLASPSPQPIIRTLLGSGASYTLELSGMSGPGTLTASIPADAATAVSNGKPSAASTSSDATVTWALPPNYSLPVIYGRLDYTATSSPSAESLDIALGAGAYVVSLPGHPNTIIKQVSGSSDGAVIAAAETLLTHPSGIVRVRAATFIGDTTDSFTYALSPPGTANRQLGYVHLTMVNNSDLDLTVGGAYVTLTDGAGAKISGAAVSFGLNQADLMPFTEVAFGVYRLVISNVVVGSIRVRSAGFIDVTQTVRSLTVGSFPEIPIVLTQSSLVASIASTVPDPTHSRAIPLTFTFSTAVSDFVAADIAVTNGAVTGFAGSGAAYTATLVPASPGPVRVEIASGAANAGGFACNAAVLTRVYDTVGPNVTINQAVGQADPSISGPLSFTLQFSAPVTGFTGSDLSFTGSTAGGVITAAVTGSGTTWTANVSGMTTGGTVVASVPADAAVANGHPTAASTSTDNSITFVPPGLGSPIVTIQQHASQPDPTAAPVILFSVHVSAAVTDFTAADVVLSGSAGGPLSAVISGSGADYTVLVSGMTVAGTVIANVPVGAASSGGLPSFAATTSDNQVTYDLAASSSGNAPAAADGRSCGAGSGLAALAMVGLVGVGLLRRRR